MDQANTAAVRRPVAARVRRTTLGGQVAVAAIVVAAGIGLTACSSSPATTAPASSQGPSAAATGGSPVPTESNPAGDIPDTTVYVPYRPASGQYEVKVPEGWARTQSATGVTFTDKLNTVRIDTSSAATPPTVDTAHHTEVTQIQAAGHNFALSDVRTVSRHAGTLVEIRYFVDSEPDAVTGKVVRDAVERYDYYSHGTEAVVSLIGPAGADNVDPWRTVTDSFRWLR